MSKTKRLGKGLGELLGREVMEEKNTESISISLVVPNEWQPRREFEPESLNALAESIKEHGVVQPVIVRKKDSGYELIAGERRLRAAQLAGLVEIPASFGAEIDGGTGASPFRIGNTCRADRACAPNCGRRSFCTAYRGNPPP